MALAAASCPDLQDLLARLEREQESASWPVVQELRSYVRVRLDAEPDEPTWPALEATLRRICQGLSRHVDQEERIVFPYVRALAGSQSAGAEPPAGTWGGIDEMAELMRREHSAMLGELDELQRLCRRVRDSELHDAIADVESLMRARIEFEDQILFPAARVAEAG